MHRGSPVKGRNPLRRPVEQLPTVTLLSRGLFSGFAWAINFSVKNSLIASASFRDSSDCFSAAVLSLCASIASVQGAVCLIVGQRLSLPYAADSAAR